MPDTIFANGSKVECSWLSGPMPAQAQVLAAGKSAKNAAGFTAPVNMRYITTNGTGTGTTNTTLATF